MARPIVVRAEWDPEAAVWVAGSADLPALITEAGSIEELRAKLAEMIPELLELDRRPSLDASFRIDTRPGPRLPSPG